MTDDSVAKNEAPNFVDTILNETDDEDDCDELPQYEPEMKQAEKEAAALAKIKKIESQKTKKIKFIKKPKMTNVSQTMRWSEMADDDDDDDYEKEPLKNKEEEEYTPENPQIQQQHHHQFTESRQRASKYLKPYVNKTSSVKTNQQQCQRYVARLHPNRFKAPRSHPILTGINQSFIQALKGMNAVLRAEWQKAIVAAEMNIPECDRAEALHAQTLFLNTNFME